MKTSHRHHTTKCAFTLLEMTIVIMVLIALISSGMFVSNKMDDWKLGRAASETLRDVYSAQRMYLSDFPTADVNAITAAKVIPYLRTGAATLPKVKSLTGTEMSIIVNQSPPVINAGSGVVYDPSGNNRDSLWDVGE